MTSATTNSEIRAMIQAQEELYEMLGIPVEDLRSAASSACKRRSMSVPAVSPTALVNSRPRRNSEVLVSAARNSDMWRHHYYSQSIDDVSDQNSQRCSLTDSLVSQRTAVLAILST